MRAVLATSNRGKVEEFRRLFAGSGIEIVLPDKVIEVEEKGQSYLENALIKAKAYHRVYSLPTIADDSGLEVDALGGYPGLFSSRFWSIDHGGIEIGDEPPDARNVRKLLRLLDGKDRSARFVAVVVLYPGDCFLASEGTCEGRIADSPRGEKGFGYDPVFIPEGLNLTMAERSPEEKDRISHRGRAVRSLLECIDHLRAVV